MSVDLVGIASIYVKLIEAIEIDTSTSFKHSFPRRTSVHDGLLAFIEKYTDCKISVFIVDFSQSSKDDNNLVLKTNSDFIPIRSFILNFEDRAEIYLNSNIKSDELSGGSSNAWLRFLVVKEALHVLLRQEFFRSDAGHTDIELNPEVILRHLEELISVPLTSVDFENLNHSNMLKTEQAAALLSCLLLYPLDRVLVDRKQLRLDTGEDLKDHLAEKHIASISGKYLIPEELVAWVLQWERLDEFEALVLQERMGFGR